MSAKTIRSESTFSVGRLGENVAERFLTERGLLLLDRNWRDGRRGEIDLIFHDGERVVFVEVKTRRGAQEGEILETVDAAKLARLKRLAAAWLSTRVGWESYRIDVMAVRLASRSTRARILWLQGADR